MAHEFVPNGISKREHGVRLTMRLSDAALRRRQTKALYPNHRLPPWFTEDATRDRSNRLLGGVQDGATGRNG
jgi:hypothetical protein